MIGLLATFVIAMAVTWFTTPVVARLAVKFGAVAVPRDRDVHEEPTPRWGGIAIYFGVVIAAVVGITFRHLQSGGEFGWTRPLAGVLIGGTFIALYGLLDDLKDLSAKWQILGIVIAAGILVAFGVRIEGLTNPMVAHKPGAYAPDQWYALSLPISAFLTMAWVLVVTKTVDAIDGLDGLAAGVCAISAATLALLAAASKQPEGPALAIFAAAVVGGCVGFLRHNYNPARIFMSTVGAQFLGLTLASLSILGTFKVAAAISVAVPLLVLGVPIFDYGIVLAKRIAHRAPLTGADNRHFHHRLLARGLTKQQAVWVIYGCTAMLCVAAIVIFNVSR